LHPGATGQSATEREIGTQPEAWLHVAEVLRAAELPATGTRVSVIGCGSSWFAAMAIAALREGAGLGETDPFCSSEAPSRDYDWTIAISRSGTTTETLAALRRMNGAKTLAIVGDRDSPIGREADRTVDLAFADEESVVQTRFVTSTIALGRAWAGDDLAPVAAEAQEALGDGLPLDVSAHDHYVFLGSGWCVGLAAEAALVVRECAGAWSEAHPAMEYRHGPISAARPGSAVWFLGPPPPGLPEEVAATGATVVVPDADPLASLVQVQRVAVALAAERGRDVDSPQHLSRAVVF
jgi:fructoselysine-6-P-deglycase FrlB-like protein